MTKQEIISALVGERWTHDDIRDFYDVLKSCRASADAVAKYQFKPGDIVRFEGRRGQLLQGTVVKRLTKNVQVRVNDLSSMGSRTWRVPPSMLTKVD